MVAFFSAQTLGLFPDADAADLRGRKALSEAIGVQCCLAAQRNDVDSMRSLVSALASRNKAIVSAGVRRNNGKLLVDVGNHAARWKFVQNNHSGSEAVQVPIFQNKSRWGTVEIRFVPLGNQFAGWLSPAVRLIGFVTLVAFVGYTWYLKRILKHLDPSSVIPDRVRATLDTLAEGVLVLDRDERIVLANKAFARYVGRSSEDLQGFKAPEIRWSQPHSDSAVDDFPWMPAIRDGVTQTGVMIGMHSSTEGRRTLMVNTTPITGGDGRQRGALATFDDVTSIEQKNVQLQEMLQVLSQSRDEIRRQNEELKTLATRDPLTSCLNRRAFRTQFETLWNNSKTRDYPLSCVMVDIDHFKSINDNHGHGVGDQVLQQIANILRSTVRESDLVCRYGGEEFCVLLPQVELADAMLMAERLRHNIETQKCAGLLVTASLGVTTTGLGAQEPRELLDEADKALYASKRSGRNRSTSWKELPANFRIDEGTTGRGDPVDGADQDVPIPFHAVTALTSALAYRDTHTAEHSRRVADLCVLAATGLMSERECYVLEVAALLHDIGKLGVPDAILLKPGPLTEEEWKVMSTHDRIGVEIIMAAFSSLELTEIVRTHHAWFGGNPREPGLPTGDDIPLRARILTIADAYDAMVSDRVYRKGRSRDEAFRELRRCAGEQFDPALVERFIAAVTDSDQSRGQPSLAVSKQTALRIGVQIERLAGALDSQDFPNLSAMAGRLASTAKNDGVPEIAELAAQLEKSAGSDPDLLTIVAQTTELLKLCRSTQTSYLDLADEGDETESGGSNIDGSPRRSRTGDPPRRRRSDAGTASRD